jgi:transposase
MRQSPSLNQERRLRRRLAAADLFAKGWSRAAVARELGVSRMTATRWRRAWKRGELARVERPGRPRKLDGAALAAALAGIPRTWSVDRVAEVLEQRTGVRYHPGHLWRVLKTWGWGAAPKPRPVPFTDPDGNALLLYGPPQRT